MINSTSGSSTANSYISLDECNTYISGMVGTTAWTLLTDADKEPYVLEACRVIESYRLNGSKATDEQALHYPAVYRTSYEFATFGILEEEIPTDIKYVQARLAYAIYKNRENYSNNSNQGITEYTLGEETVKYSNSSSDLVKKFDEVSYRILNKYVKRFGRIL